MIERDRELLAFLARVNGGMGQATIRLMDNLHDGYLPPGQLRELGDVLRCLAADLTARADELDGASAPMVIDAAQG
ncbi:MAG: hypothetical protein ACRDQ7_21010 [Haloechinothrix sp.]